MNYNSIDDCSDGISGKNLGGITWGDLRKHLLEQVTYRRQGRDANRLPVKEIHYGQLFE
ncbi:MAG: hypothetical protein JSV41_05980 [Gemmatimonadota bacterium]|nr:MAG: hypothetical protein JSV41_05980 [Gemmatimonadota bacterium]